MDSDVNSEFLKLFGDSCTDLKISQEVIDIKNTPISSAIGPLKNILDLWRQLNVVVHAWRDLATSVSNIEEDLTQLDILNAIEKCERMEQYDMSIDSEDFRDALSNESSDYEDWQDAPGLEMSNVEHVQGTVDEISSADSDTKQSDGEVRVMVHEQPAPAFVEPEGGPALVFIRHLVDLLRPSRLFPLMRRALSRPGEDSERPIQDAQALEMVNDLLLPAPSALRHYLFRYPGSTLPHEYIAKFRFLWARSLVASPGLGPALYLYFPCDLPPAFGYPCWEQEATCCVCYRDMGALPSNCCYARVCEGCLSWYLREKLVEGEVSFPCVNIDCLEEIPIEKVMWRLTSKEKHKLRRRIVDRANDPSQKTCPQCDYITKLTSTQMKQFDTERSLISRTMNRKREGPTVKCPECNLTWCFDCHAPEHPGESCRERRRLADRQVKRWAAQSTVVQSQRNAWPCPNCGTYIERTDGCPHMSCSVCNTKWCYRCGGRRRNLLIFGHDFKYSVLGCTDLLLPDRPHLRRLIRGVVTSLILIISIPLLVGIVGLFVLTLPFTSVGLLCFQCCKKRDDHIIDRVSRLRRHYRFRAGNLH